MNATGIRPRTVGCMDVYLLTDTPNADVERHTITKTRADVLRGRLQARFAPGVGHHLAVPDSWLPRLDSLDSELADIDPDYQLLQIKTKHGGLRYYVESCRIPACCCALWDALSTAGVAHTDEADAVLVVHESAPGCVEAWADRESVDEAIAAVIHRYESASYAW